MTPDPLFEPAEERLRAAPVPLPRTVRRRSSLPIQLARFVMINLRILAMVTRAHH